MTRTARLCVGELRRWHGLRPYTRAELDLLRLRDLLYEIGRLEKARRATPPGQGVLFQGPPAGPARGGR